MQIFSPTLVKRGLVFLQGFLFSLVLNSCSYSAKTSRKLLEAASGKSYDVIIVPGVPFEDGQWSRTMKGRIYWAKYLYDHGYAKNLMFSGSAVYTPYYEGEIMAMYAVALGIPREHVFSETRAEHSTENVYYSYIQARALGFNTVAVATDPFQAKLLKRFTRKRVSPGIAMLPMVMDTMRQLEPAMIDPPIDFQAAHKDPFVSIRKRENFFQRLRGTLGRNIKNDSLTSGVTGRVR